MVDYVKCSLVRVTWGLARVLLWGVVRGKQSAGPDHPPPLELAPTAEGPSSLAHFAVVLATASPFRAPLDNFLLYTLVTRAQRTGLKDFVPQKPIGVQIPTSTPIGF